MANLRTLPVIQDSGSEELRRLRLSYNALLDAVGNLLDAMEAATAVGDIATAATTMLALLETDATHIPRIGGEPNIPVGPSRPVTG